MPFPVRPPGYVDVCDWWLVTAGELWWRFSWMYMMASGFTYLIMNLYIVCDPWQVLFCRKRAREPGEKHHGAAHLHERVRAAVGGHRDNTTGGQILEVDLCSGDQHLNVCFHCKISNLAKLLLPSLVSWSKGLWMAIDNQFHDTKLFRLVRQILQQRTLRGGDAWSHAEELTVRRLNFWTYCTVKSFQPTYNTLKKHPVEWTKSKL